jgi:hypothetical protein
MATHAVNLRPVDFNTTPLSYMLIYSMVFIVCQLLPRARSSKRDGQSSRAETGTPVLP